MTLIYKKKWANQSSETAFTITSLLSLKTINRKFCERDHKVKESFVTSAATLESKAQNSCF